MKKPRPTVKPAPRTVKGIQAALGLDAQSAREILAHERGEGDFQAVAQKPARKKAG